MSLLVLFFATVEKVKSLFNLLNTYFKFLSLQSFVVNL